jgi:hypothetical protein
MTGTHLKMSKVVTNQFLKEQIIVLKNSNKDKLLN